MPMLADAHISSLGYLWSNQRVVYNDHKRVHALKFQAVTLPNGLIANIYGPVGKPQIFFFSQSNLFSLHCHVYGIFVSLYLPLNFAVFFVEILLIIDNSLFNFLFPRHIPYVLVKCKACMT